jgi:hypothetical protein
MLTPLININILRHEVQGKELMPFLIVSVSLNNIDARNS